MDEEYLDGAFEGQIHHLRFGAILTDYKTRRFLIATQDTIDHPLVFLREEFIDAGTYYALYDNALTSDQAKEILDLLEADNTQKARRLLKKHFKEDKPRCQDVGPAYLDDMIPDEWYLAWKEMEGIITSSVHLVGYASAELREELY